MAKSKVKFKSNYKKIEKKFYKEADTKLKSVGKMLKSYLNDQLEGPRTGMEYPMPLGPKILPGDVYHNNSPTYIASAPGEYPAKRLGDLRATIGWFVTTHKSVGSVCLTIGSPMEYADDLEFDMERPFIGRAVSENLLEIEEMLDGAGALQWLSDLL